MLTVKKSMVAFLLGIFIFSEQQLAFMQEQALPSTSEVSDAKDKTKKEKAPEEFIVTKEDHMHTLKVKANDILQIRLPENPSTGHSWKFTRFDARYFELLNIENFIPSNAIPMVGQPGLKVITLQAKKVGTSTIDLLNYREWEGPSNAIDQFSITITVVDKVEDEVKKEK